MTNSDRIQYLEKTSATLVERVDNLRKDLDRHEEMTSEISRQIQDIDRRLTVAEDHVGILEKRIDDLLTRRWDLWKLFLAAFLGSLLTVAAGFVSKAIERVLEVHQGHFGPVAPVPVRK